MVYLTQHKPTKSKMNSYRLWTERPMIFEHPDWDESIGIAEMVSQDDIEVKLYQSIIGRNVLLYPEIIENEKWRGEYRYNDVFCIFTRLYLLRK